MAQQIPEITSIPSNSNVLKILNQVIKRYNSLGSIYTFKGSVQTYDDLLAIQNPQIGDVYNVIQEDEEHQIAAGSNFVWDGTVWDNLGGSLAGLVQSINGINPDSLGNVLLPLIKNITTNEGVLTITKNDDTTIQTDNIKKLYTVGLGQTVDLNNLVEAGIYMCSNDSYAANYENCPVQKSFLLEVQQANDGSMVYQFLTQYNDGSTEAGNQYVRTYQATNGWSAWRMAGSGSNLTTYTSLEQLGITPGEETFESIHNALPLNSELVYDITPNNFNNSIYPNEGYGQMWCIKISDSTSTNFMFITQYIDALNVYTRYFNQNFPTNVVEWTQIAKQSDLTNLSNSVVKSVNGIKPTNGNVNITGVPTGTILALLDDEVPEGYLPAEGAAVSRTTYADLFNIIGTKFGEGDGSTTFNLPNLVGKFLEGNGVPGTLKEPGLPDISGRFSRAINNAFVPGNNTRNGCFQSIVLGGNSTGSNSVGTYPSGVEFKASYDNPIYGNSDTVQPKAVTVKFCIKY